MGQESEGTGPDGRTQRTAGAEGDSPKEARPLEEEPEQVEGSGVLPKLALTLFPFLLLLFFLLMDWMMRRRP